MTVPPLLGSHFSQTIANREFIRIGADMNLFTFTPEVVAEIREKYTDDVHTSVNNFRDTYNIAVTGEGDYRDKTTTFASFITENSVDIVDVNGFGEVVNSKATNVFTSMFILKIIYFKFKLK